jgi:hypothetical protein
VECIGRGKASAPYEFGVKASIVTTNARAPGGQFVLHARAMPGNPYDGRTLRDILEDTQRLTGREIERAYVDKGYRGHDAAQRTTSVSSARLNQLEQPARAHQRPFLMAVNQFAHFFSSEYIDARGRSSGLGCFTSTVAYPIGSS